MQVRELGTVLEEYPPGLHVVQRDPDSGKIHVVRELLDEKTVANGHRDYRCGPHNMDPRPGDTVTEVVHVGQQRWHGDYPGPPTCRP